MGAASDGGGSGTPSQAQVGMIRKLRLGRQRDSAAPKERVCRAACNRGARVHGGEGVGVRGATADGGGGGGRPSLAQVG